MPLIRKPLSPQGPPTDLPPNTAAEPVATLATGDAAARWAAARAADQPADAPALAAALRIEEDPRVRVALLTSLAGIGDAVSMAAVLPLLRSDAAERRTEALDALRAMPAALDAHLPALLSDADADVRVLACDLARSLPGTTATALLVALLEREPEENVCAAAVDVLSEVGTRAAVPALVLCGERFAHSPFLRFATQVACQRLGAQGVGP